MEDRNIQADENSADENSENKTVKANHKESDKDRSSKSNEDAAIKPDPETLHTTDPQEHMEGPISSLVQNARKEADKED